MNQVDEAQAVDVATLLHAAYAAQAALEQKLDAIGLSMAKLAALQALSSAGESLPLSQLADRLSCVKSNITQLVDRLEADGLVERQFDPRDRRARLARLTSAGRKACQEGTVVQRAAERQLLRKLSPAESQQLAALLSKIAGS